MRVRIDAIKGDNLTVIFYESHQFAGRLEISKNMFYKFCRPFNVTPKFFIDWEGQLL